MSDTQLIKDKIDIVDFISEYLQVKPSGRNFKALCPFHHEKTPSFMVNRERQNWHCFGCNKGGDIFSFVQEMEGMEFVEALRLCANRAGVSLTSYSGGESTGTEKTRLKELNAAAARFFYNILREMPQAERARVYLRGRGLTNATIETWQIGFIPDQWDLLTQYLLKKGHSIDDLVATGLTIQRDGASPTTRKGFYDRFRGRVMFPIRDVHGEIVGFTGRVLVEHEKSGGKYINTPQTIIYDKSRVIFGLYQAKQDIKAKDQIVMVEGQMDAIACHQAGMRNVVATSGTALTIEHVQLLKRYSHNLSIAFDTDLAGENASKRGVALALEAGMSVKVIHVPGGFKDPDECVQKALHIWHEAVEKAQDVIAWYIGSACRRRDITQLKEKQAVVEEVLPEIIRIPYAVERDHWLRELASRIGVEVTVLREDMLRIARTMKKKSSGVRTEESPSPSPSASETKLSRLDLLFERVLILLLLFPQFRGMTFSLSFLEGYLSPGPSFYLYEIIKKSYTMANSLSLDELRSLSSKDSNENIIDLLLLKGDLEYPNIIEAQAKDEMNILLHHLKEEWIRKKRQELQRDIARAEREGTDEILAKLLQQFGELSV